MACGIFPDQGWNLCLLHWQADSLPWAIREAPDDCILKRWSSNCLQLVGKPSPGGTRREATTWQAKARFLIVLQVFSRRQSPSRTKENRKEREYDLHTSAVTATVRGHQPNLTSSLSLSLWKFLLRSHFKMSRRGLLWWSSG